MSKYCRFKTEIKQANLRFNLKRLDEKVLLPKPYNYKFLLRLFDV